MWRSASQLSIVIILYSTQSEIVGHIQNSQPCFFPISVTNDLLPQPRYSIRGLMSDTVYDLKITAHNHAGSTSLT